MPLLNLQKCPEVLKIYRKKQKLKNVETEFEAFCICSRNWPFRADIMEVFDGLLVITIPISLIIILSLTIQVAQIIRKVTQTVDEDQETTSAEALSAST